MSYVVFVGKIKIVGTLGTYVLEHATCFNFFINFLHCRKQTRAVHALVIWRARCFTTTHDETLQDVRVKNAVLMAALARRSSGRPSTNPAFIPAAHLSVLCRIIGRRGAADGNSGQTGECRTNEWTDRTVAAPACVHTCMYVILEMYAHMARIVHRSNFFNPTQPNPSQSENAGPTNQSNPQPNRTPHNQQQTFAHKEYNLGTLFHRNIITVSKTPVNKHDNC